MKTDTRNAKTFVCISCEFKGVDFIRECHALGNTVYLVTAEKTRDKAWPVECIREIFFMPEEDGRLWKMDDLILGMSYLMRQTHVDRIIALDDYDVHKVAQLREEFRMPGMGQTTARHFYDKLAMRMQASENGIPVPEFSALFEDKAIQHFLDSTEGPWLVKPRSDAGALGIRKIYTPEDFWNLSESLGENRFHYLIECFKPGNVYHVDSLTINYEIQFTRCSGYRQPPFEIAHGGGIFSSATLPLESEENKKLIALNKKVLKAFGMRSGASHSEFIRNSANGKYYFLETSARVGGANLAEMVEMSSGVNLWREWARIEQAVLTDGSYKAPGDNKKMAGIIASLSHKPTPDYASFARPELAWTMQKDHHIGLIYRADTADDVHALLDAAAERIREEYHAVLPLKE